MSGRLDRKLVKQLTGKPSTEFAGVEQVIASNQGLSEVGSLSYLPALKRLDLSRNQLRELGGVEGCTSLRQLNLSSNQLTSLKTLKGFPSLQVLNVGQNQIVGKLKLSNLPSLGAVIADNNAITGLKDLGGLSALNTLVLKSNRISTLGSSLAGCSRLAKLSMAHNQLSDLATSLEGCPQLAELRLGHNQLSGLPASLAGCPRLKIVDLGGNAVEDLAAVKVLAQLPRLHSLTLKGCPVANKEDYQQEVQALLPHLQSLDNKRLDGSVRRHKGTQGAEENLALKAEAAAPVDIQEGCKGAPKRRKVGKAEGLQVERSLPDVQLLASDGQEEKRWKNSKNKEGGCLPEAQQNCGKKQKRKREAEIKGDVAENMPDPTTDARVQEPSRPKTKKKRHAAGGAISHKVGGEGQEEPVVEPKTKEEKKKMKLSEKPGGHENLASAEVRNAGVTTSLSSVGLPESSLPESKAQTVKDLKPGMRGAQVGMALQSVLGSLDGARPLAPGWE